MINKEKIIIRRIEIEDIEAVADIKIDGWKTAYKGIIDAEFLDNMDRNAEIEKRRNDYNQSGFIVAVIDNEVVGFSRYTFDSEDSKRYSDIDCELRAIYVKSSLKKKGIGKNLMKYVINQFKSSGKKKMILWCFKENYPSRAFYEKMGGKVFDYKKIKFGDKDYDIVSYVYNIQEL